jgi:hypothetical protein
MEGNVRQNVDVTSFRLTRETLVTCIARYAFETYPHTERGGINARSIHLLIPRLADGCTLKDTDEERRTIRSNNQYNGPPNDNSRCSNHGIAGSGAHRAV